MRYILLLLIYSTFQVVNSQNILIIGQVFDFKPGDVFHYMDDLGHYSEY